MFYHLIERLTVSLIYHDNQIYQDELFEYIGPAQFKWVDVQPFLSDLWTELDKKKLAKVASKTRGVPGY